MQSRNEIYTSTSILLQVATLQSAQVLKYLLHLYSHKTSTLEVLIHWNLGILRQSTSRVASRAYHFPKALAQHKYLQPVSPCYCRSDTQRD